LRSALARLKAEVELAELDGTQPPLDRLLVDLREALSLLGAVESAAYSVGPVVVIDDDERLGELTARGLRRVGFDAGSRSQLQTLRPGEVVVFDLGMAASLSADESAALRAARPIVVTGAADPASRALAASFDASEYLLKPVELEDLAAAISRRFAEQNH
jgi:ActR/RegA family two-component response regulator